MVFISNRNEIYYTLYLQQELNTCKDISLLGCVFKHERCIGLLYMSCAVLLALCLFRVLRKVLYNMSMFTLIYQLLYVIYLSNVVILWIVCFYKIPLTSNVKRVCFWNNFHLVRLESQIIKKNIEVPKQG